MGPDSALAEPKHHLLTIAKKIEFLFFGFFFYSQGTQGPVP